MRVALVHPWFWPEVRRGSERMVRDLADDLARRGHRPRIVAGHRGAPSRRVEDGVPVVRVPALGERRLRRRAFDPGRAHVPFAYAALASGDDEVVHAFHITSALAAARWRRRTGRPAVLSIMGLPDRAAIVGTRDRIELLRRAVAGTDAVVVLSHAAAAACERWLGIEARVIHPGVDLAAFTPSARSPEPTIVCAANLADPRKRGDLLVEAFARVRRERPTARLLLDRPRDPALARRLAAPGVELVELDGGATDQAGSRRALAGHFGAAWVGVLPSVDEAFGLVLVEALACGTPVVGTRSGALAEIVDRDAIGRLFDGDDPAALARALVEALDLAADPATAAACRDRAEAFSAARTGAAHEALYRELLTAR